MEKVWERIKKGFMEGAAATKEAIDIYSRIAKLKIDEFATKRKLDRTYIDIGERVYDLSVEGKGADAGADLAVKSSIETVTALKKELVAIGKQIRDVKDEANRKGVKTPDDDDGYGI